MGQVRWASWTVAIAAVLATAGSLAVAQELRGITSDKPAALVIYPMVTLDSVAGVDTTIRLANTDPQNPVDAHCFYLDANSHCVGGEAHNTICTNNPSVCTGGMCMPGRTPPACDPMAPIPIVFSTCSAASKYLPSALRL